MLKVYSPDTSFEKRKNLLQMRKNNVNWKYFILSAESNSSTLCCAPAVDFYLYFLFLHRLCRRYRWKPVWNLDLWDLIVCLFLSMAAAAWRVLKENESIWTDACSKQNRRTCHIISFQLLLCSFQLKRGHEVRRFVSCGSILFDTLWQINKNNTWNTDNVPKNSIQ